MSPHQVVSLRWPQDMASCPPRHSSQSSMTEWEQSRKGAGHDRKRANGPVNEKAGKSGDGSVKADFTEDSARGKCANVHGVPFLGGGCAPVHSPQCVMCSCNPYFTKPSDWLCSVPSTEYTQDTWEALCLLFVLCTRPAGGCSTSTGDRNHHCHGIFVRKPKCWTAIRLSVMVPSCLLKI